MQIFKEKLEEKAPPHIDRGKSLGCIVKGGLEYGAVHLILCLLNKVWWEITYAYIFQKAIKKLMRVGYLKRMGWSVVLDGSETSRCVPFLHTVDFWIYDPFQFFFKFLNIWPIPKIFNFQKIFLLNRGHLFSDFLKDMCKKYIKARNKDKLIGLFFLMYAMWCLRYLFVRKPCLCHLVVQKDTPAHHSRIAGQRLVERLAWLPCLLPS